MDFLERMRELLHIVEMFEDVGSVNLGDGPIGELVEVGAAADEVDAWARLDIENLPTGHGRLTADMETQLLVLLDVLDVVGWRECSVHKVLLGCDLGQVGRSIRCDQLSRSSHQIRQTSRKASSS